MSLLLAVNAIYIMIFSSIFKRKNDLTLLGSVSDLQASFALNFGKFEAFIMTYLSTYLACNLLAF